MGKYLPILLLFFFFNINDGAAQLIVTSNSNAQALAQSLVGDGITISNVTLTADPIATGFFKNASGTNIGMDSGIVLTNGRAATLKNNPITPTTRGVDGDGNTSAYINFSESGAFANNNLGLGGDADLSLLLGGSATYDATILEFDFVPLGDSIKFNYVFSSEEYPDYACSQFNDAFAFFISGPGITGLQNIALIPGSTDPVTIRNINNQGCGPYPQYYIDNGANTFFTHNGQTTLLTAFAKVQPCQTYHLKLVIADVSDGKYDSGVFLESKSLTSGALKLNAATSSDASGNNYLAEGCISGKVKIQLPVASPYNQVINLEYGGTATNGVDVQMLPSSITMPANQTDTSLDIIPIVDNLPEGIEYLKIYLLAPCNASTRVDSLEIQIRDFDILDITPDTLITCKGSTIQLNASAGYTTYTWDADPTLSSTTINNPIATPIASQTTYSCTADLLNCHARDSAFIQLKTVQLLSQQNVNCKDSSTGQIIVSHDTNWVQPVQYSINGGVFQSDSIFNNLPVGPYTIRVKDANCIDSVTAFILQDYPQLLATSTPVAATCSGNADGSITINANGGGNPYLYSIDDGVTYQSANLFAVKKGTYKIKVKDNNSCTTASQTVIVDLNNTVTVDAGQNEIICEGKGIQLNAVSNATSFSWTPIATLTNGNSQTPIAMPKITTKYYVTATQGICNNIDSLIVNVNPTPKADAGGDVNICFGANAQLFGAGGIEYTWTPSTYLNNSKAQSPTSIKPLKSIDYYLKVKDAKGCESINFDTVSIIVTPAIKIFAGNDTMVAINQPVQLHAVEVGTNKVTSYEWAPSYGLNNAAIAKPIATLDRDITYYVTGTTAIHCQGSDTINIKVYKGPEIYVPTAFTPNGDGRNDLLRPIAIGMKTYHYFRIYNRWGQIIFNTADFNKGWDGKINGITQDPGSYVWIAEAVDYKGNIIQQKGVSTIIR